MDSRESHSAIDSQLTFFGADEGVDHLMHAQLGEQGVLKTRRVTRVQADLDVASTESLEVVGERRVDQGDRRVRCHVRLLELRGTVGGEWSEWSVPYTVGVRWT
jgi:hypothetical protein